MGSLQGPNRGHTIINQNIKAKLCHIFLQQNDIVGNEYIIDG